MKTKLYFFLHIPLCLTAMNAPIELPIQIQARDTKELITISPEQAQETTFLANIPKNIASSYEAQTHNIMSIDYPACRINTLLKLLEISSTKKALGLLSQQIASLLAQNKFAHYNTEKALQITRLADFLGAKTIVQAACLFWNQTLSAKSDKSRNELITLMQQNLPPSVCSTIILTNQDLVALFQKGPIQRTSRSSQKILSFNNNDRLVIKDPLSLQVIHPFKGFITHKVDCDQNSYHGASYKHWHTYANNNGTFVFDSTSRKITKVSSDITPLSLAIFHKCVAIAKNGTIDIYTLLKARRIMQWKQKATFEHEQCCKLASEHSQQLLASGNQQSIKIWDLKSKKLLKEIKVNHINTLTFSPDGQTLACIETSDDNDPIKATIFNVYDEQFSSYDHQKITSLCFSPNNKLLITAGSTLVYIWNLKTQKKVTALPHDETIYQVFFSPFTHSILTQSGKSSLSMWNPYDGNLLQSFSISNKSPIRYVTMNTKGDLVAVENERNTISILRIPKVSSQKSLHEVELNKLDFLKKMAQFKKNGVTCFLQKNSQQWKEYDKLPPKIKALVPVSTKRKYKRNNNPFI